MFPQIWNIRKYWNVCKSPNHRCREEKLTFVYAYVCAWKWPCWVLIPFFFGYSEKKILTQAVFFFIRKRLMIKICNTPGGMYLLKVNNRNTRARCKICLNLTIKTPERRHWRRSGVFTVNVKQISHLFLLFL